MCVGGNLRSVPSLMPVFLWYVSHVVAVGSLIDFVCPWCGKHKHCDSSVNYKHQGKTAVMRDKESIVMHKSVF